MSWVGYLQLLRYSIFCLKNIKMIFLKYGLSLSMALDYDIHDNRMS